MRKCKILPWCEFGTVCFYLQVIIASWEMTLLLVLIKIVVAGAFGVNISRKVTEERSTLRREFYIKFAKVSVDALLCKP